MIIVSSIPCCMICGNCVVQTCAWMAIEDSSPPRLVLSGSFIALCQMPSETLRVLFKSGFTGESPAIGYLNSHRLPLAAQGCDFVTT